MTNKTQEVLKHLQKHKTITSMDAIRLYGATRLSAIIFNLRKKGHDITDVWQEDIDRYGNTCRYVKYVYKNTPDIASNPRRLFNLYFCFKRKEN